MSDALESVLSRALKSFTRVVPADIATAKAIKCATSAGCSFSLIGIYQPRFSDWKFETNALLLASIRTAVPVGWNS